MSGSRTGELGELVESIERQRLVALERRERVLQTELRSAHEQIARLHREVAELRAALDRGPR